MTTQPPTPYRLLTYDNGVPLYITSDGGLTKAPSKARVFASQQAARGAMQKAMLRHKWRAFTVRCVQEWRDRP